MKVLVALFLFSAISYSSAINVTQCHDIEKPIEGLENRVKLGNCKKPPCRLRKNSVVKIELNVKPERDIEKILNSIHAYIAGVPFPFPGVDGTDACKNIYSADGLNQVGCPLKKGQDYLYRNNIEVLQIYPRVKAVIHWGLTPTDGKDDVICFEIPARITN
ncbi:NPC intracellular cholesterol transporter 2-like [Tribolium madens]|uniref:NPC intracellular cholesterol transporter 2-like n=1 Tax=Tribolium madens TaxID=41895 RepID=UPI001CF74377|nr:NPC intracellular cholesterol transporter 2-like [Tribolium madens]